LAHAEIPSRPQGLRRRAGSTGRWSARWHSSAPAQVRRRVV